MTGFGDARRETESMILTVEARSINNRYLKVSVRLPDGFGSLEPRLEAAVRKRVRRGTVQVDVRAERTEAGDIYRIDDAVLDAYRRQIEAVTARWNRAESIRIEALLALPGVIPEAPAAPPELNQADALVLATLDEALQKLAAMRRQEGLAIAEDMRTHCRIVAQRLDDVAERAPHVVDDYRQRLTERVSRSLELLDVSLDPADVIREVTLFQERCDISEEIARLRSHLDQFQRIMDGPASSGRKLDFLSQEMFREANTIGSKSNDVAIAQHVVEIKAAIERLREQVQNVE